MNSCLLVLASCIITLQIHGHNAIHVIPSSNGESDGKTESIFGTKTSSSSERYKTSHQKRDVSESYCASGWRTFGEMCYKYAGMERGKRWREAEQFCVNEGGNLASIHSTELNEVLTVNVRKRVWIGLHDIQQEIKFKWTDKSSVDFENWASNQPSRKYGTIEEDCVEIYYSYGSDHNGKWNDVDCNDLRPFICQKTKDNPCLPTMDNSCNKSGVCEERKDKKGYECKCNELFSGKYCEHDGDAVSTSVVGIIVGIAIVGSVLVVAIIVAAFRFRRWKRKEESPDYIGLQQEI